MSFFGNKFSKDNLNINVKFEDLMNDKNNIISM